MKPVTVETVEALVRLRQNQDFSGPIVAWLKESLAEEDRANRMAHGDLLLVGQGQGRAQNLQTILDEVNTAEKTLARLKMTRANQGRTPQSAL